MYIYNSVMQCDFSINMVVNLPQISNLTLDLYYYYFLLKCALLSNWLVVDTYNISKLNSIIHTFEQNMLNNSLHYFSIIYTTYHVCMESIGLTFILICTPLKKKKRCVQNFKYIGFMIRTMIFFTSKYITSLIFSLQVYTWI